MATHPDSGECDKRLMVKLNGVCTFNITVASQSIHSSNRRAQQAVAWHTLSTFSEQTQIREELKGSFFTRDLFTF